MQGMSCKTGEYLGDLDHLKQSIIDILTTPIGSRVMRRDYGSSLFRLIDRPVNKELFQQIYAAVAEALDNWEPRIKLEKIQVTEIKESRIKIDLTLVYLITQQKFTIKDVVI